MRAAYDIVIVGGGHNGLVTGGLVARAGLRTLILERRAVAGGAVGTVELAPGYRSPQLAHTAGRFRPSVVRELRLADHGLTLVAPEVRVFAPQPGGRAVTLWTDHGRTFEELAAWSARDADGYLALDREVRSLGGFLARLGAATPPDLRAPGLGDALAGLSIGRAFRGLTATGSRALVRVIPMAVADYVAEYVAEDPVRAVLATRGILYGAVGPWSGGTVATLLTDSATADAGAAGQSVFVRGGPGALADALVHAARAAGAEVRTDAEVARIVTREGRVTGVALVNGEEIEARAVASGADPKRTLTQLVDPVSLGPTLAWRADNLRLPGVTAKVNLALGALPTFPAAGTDAHAGRRLRGRILVGATGIDDLERAHDAAKFGEIPDAPLLEATIPSLVDPALAPEGRHVMSVTVQYAPYHVRGEGWDARREALGDLVLRRLEEVAPGIGSLVEARQVITPLDLERDFGLTEGHPLHAEHGLDQWYAWRPLLGHARYRLGGIAGLYLCGSGAHPGGGVTGGPGANAAAEIIADLRRRR